MPKTQQIEKPRQEETSSVVTGGAGILDDEFPSPPPQTVHSVSGDIPFNTGADFSGEIPADVWDSIPDKDEAMKLGTYHFRLKGYKKGFTDGNDGKPNYKLAWVCQEEPYTGRFVYDNAVTWACPQDIKDANDAASPRCQEARKTVKDRLFRARKMLSAIGVDLRAFNNNFDTFLNSEPECKIKIRPSERMVWNGKMDKDGKKVYEGTGEVTQNEIMTYHPLQAPTH
jgi:hypothetical protein